METFQGHADSVQAIAFRRTGKHLRQLQMTAPYDWWDTVTGKERQIIRGHTGPVTGVVFSPDGKTLASGSSDKTVRLWDGDRGMERQILRGHSCPVKAIAFSPNGRTPRIWLCGRNQCASGMVKQDPRNER